MYTLLMLLINIHELSVTHTIVDVTGYLYHEAASRLHLMLKWDKAFTCGVKIVVYFYKLFVFTYWIIG